MNKLVTWFKENIYPGGGKPQPEFRAPKVRVRPMSERTIDKTVPMDVKGKPGQQADAEPDGVTSLAGRVEEVGPGKNVFVPSKYRSGDGGTQDSLKIIDEDELEIAEEDEGGIDPYNTGHFKVGDSWKKTFRK